MRKGFTMIELIFVIVILGILAAVAIPRLTATRDDATISKLAANLSTVVSDAGAYYTSQGLANWQAATWGVVSNVDLQNANNAMTTARGVDIQTQVFLNSDATHNCFTIITTDDGNLTIANGADTASAVCTGAQTIARDLVKTHSFGGVGIVR